MPESLLKFLDVFFFGFHSILILFNVFGWMIPRWRLANLITLCLTAFSWFFLGIWYGWGYCFCTDWHWQIRNLLGYENSSSSYIHFLILKITHVDLPENLVDYGIAILFFTSFSISIYLNIQKFKRRKKDR